MRYGEAYRIVEFNETILGKIESMLANMDLQITQSKLHQEKLSEENPKRVSNQAWINEISFCKYFLGLGMKINESCLWNFDIKGIEPIQYGIYGKGGKYDWHADQHKKPIKGLVRKISMTLFMSNPEEYEGGEFDLELRSPDFNSRFDTFKLKKGAAIFFKSDAYHRVRPVSSGVRKSIVAWYNGPSFR